MKTTKQEIKRAALSTPMVFGKVPQDVIDTHHKATVDVIRGGNADAISFHLACINYLKDMPGYEHIRYAAQNSVMHGWLTVNAANAFIVKGE